MVFNCWVGYLLVSLLFALLFDLCVGCCLFNLFTFEFCVWLLVGCLLCTTLSLICLCLEFGIYSHLMLTFYWFLENVCYLVGFGIVCGSFLGLLLWLLVCVICLLTDWHAVWVVYY